MPPERDPYAAAWADWRRRRAWSFVIFMTGLAASCGAWAMRSQLPLGNLLFVGTTLAWNFSLYLHPSRRFRCPHCKGKFGVAKKCLACGIRAGTPKSAVDEAEKLRQAGPRAERAAEGAAGHRVEETTGGVLDTGAQATEDVSRARGGA
jgi:hypothetical protein